VAKSVFAGLALMRLAELFEGEDVYNELVRTWLPAESGAETVFCAAVYTRKFTKTGSGQTIGNTLREKMCSQARPLGIGAR